MKAAMARQAAMSAAWMAAAAVVAMAMFSGSAWGAQVLASDEAWLDTLRRTRAAQESLVALGFQVGADGFPGPRTRQAVMAFQAAAELEPTGRLDRRTRDKLAETALYLEATRLAARAKRARYDAEPVKEGKGDAPFVDEMLVTAETDAEGVRLAAVDLLAEFRTARSRAALGIVLFGNSLPAARSAAAEKLGAYGDAASLYALALAHQTETDELVRAVIETEIARNLPVEISPSFGIAAAGGPPRLP